MKLDTGAERAQMRIGDALQMEIVSTARTRGLRALRLANSAALQPTHTLGTIPPVGIEAIIDPKGHGGVGHPSAECLWGAGGNS